MMFNWSVIRQAGSWTIKGERKNDGAYCANSRQFLRQFFSSLHSQCWEQQMETINHDNQPHLRIYKDDAMLALLLTDASLLHRHTPDTSTCLFPFTDPAHLTWNWALRHRNVFHFFLICTFFTSHTTNHHSSTQTLHLTHKYTIKSSFSIANAPFYTYTHKYAIKSSIFSPQMLRSLLKDSPIIVEKVQVQWLGDP